MESKIIAQIKFQEFIRKLTRLFFLIFVSGIPFAEGMEASESRVSLGSLLSIVGETRSRTKSEKESWTLHSRQQHFKNFINKMQLKNNYALIGFSQEIRNLLMAAYTVTLALGYTLKCMFIKADTVSKYLNTVEELSITYKIINPSLNFMGKDITSSMQSSKNQKDGKKFQIEKNR